VFVHGWSCDRRYWRHQLDAFAERHRAVALDLAGHGESGAGRRQWTMAGFGDDVAAVVRHLGLGEVVLVGQSMGGDVAVEAALRLAGQVTGVVWADTYHTLGDPPTGEELEASQAPFREDFVAATRALVRRMSGPATPDDLAEWVAADMSAAAPEAALDALGRAVGNEPAAADALGRLTCPVVAINAGWRPTDAALARHGVRSVVLPGAGHFLMLEDPDGFNRLLAEVVDGFARSR
jgi:pimeloyl-ACP methyl ester carboxylesterase